MSQNSIKKLVLFFVLLFLTFSLSSFKQRNDGEIIKSFIKSGNDYSPNKKYVAKIGITEGESRTLSIVNTETKKEQKYDDVDINGIVWMPDSSGLIFAVSPIYGERPGIYLWNMKDNKVMKINPTNKFNDVGHMFELYGISKDGNVVYYYHYWDVVTEDELKKRENFKEINIEELKRH